MIPDSPVLGPSDAAGVCQCYASGFATDHPEWSGLASQFASKAAAIHREPARALACLIGELAPYTGTPDALPVATILTRLGIDDADKLASTIPYAEGLVLDQQANVITSALQKRARETMEARFRSMSAGRVKQVLDALPYGTLARNVNAAALSREWQHLDSTWSGSTPEAVASRVLDRLGQCAGDYVSPTAPAGWYGTALRAISSDAASQQVAASQPVAASVGRM